MERWEDFDSSFKSRLSTTLWARKEWDGSSGVGDGAESTSLELPSQRVAYAQQYFQYVEDIVRSYITTTSFEHDDYKALKSFDDLLHVIRCAVANAHLPRRELLREIFQDSQQLRPLKQDLHDDDDETAASAVTAGQELALDLAVQVIFMINCSPRHQSFYLLELGSQHIPWRSNDVSLIQFVKECFPVTAAPSGPEDAANNKKDDSATELGSNLTAANLKKQAGLTLRPTNDLRNHLRLDRKNNVVEIFHHVAFLKEQLRLTRDEADSATVDDLIKLGGLPRQLLLETLDSIQTLLFPRSDPRSRRLLRNLCSPSGGFDPDCLRFESASIRRADEHQHTNTTTTYIYWAARLSDLYEELECPRPKGWMQVWLERKSGARYVMLATLLGVIFAVLLGIAGLVVGILQVWVGYMAWKYPVSNNNK